MSEFVLSGVIAALIGFIAYERYEMRKERNKYINALLSKDAVQLRDLEFTEKLKMPKEEKVPNDLIDTKDLTDEQFMQQIKEEVN